MRRDESRRHHDELLKLLPVRPAQVAETGVDGGKKLPVFNLPELDVFLA